MHSSTITNNCPAEPGVRRRSLGKRNRFGGRSLIGYFAAFFLLSCVSGCRSNHHPPDPLAGWHVYLGVIPPQITKDYQEYIKTLPVKEQEYLGGETFYKDDAGRFAVKIDIALYGTFKIHILIYDSANKRVNVIRYNGGHYMS